MRALSIMLAVLLLAGRGTANNNASPSPRNQTNGTTANNVQNMNENRGYTTNNVDGWTPDNTNTDRLATQMITTDKLTLQPQIT